MRNLATALMAATGNRELPDTTWDLDYAELDFAEPWDASTLVHVSFQSISTYDTSPEAIWFKPDGTKMYIMGSSSDDVHYWTLSTPWDPTTLTYDSYFYVGGYETLPYGMAFDPDGERFYVIGATGDDVNQFSLSTAWDLSTASYVRTSSSLSSIDSAPHGIFFKPDGTKMYMMGGANDSVYEFTLSTAWDVSTLSLNSSATFSVNSYESSPTDVFFKDDGTTMYVIGNLGDEINEFTLSTAWDLSTASYRTFFVIQSQESSPKGMYIRPDGGMLFVVGASGDGVDTYYMGYNKSLYISAATRGICFKPDGTKFYAIGGSADILKEYDMSTAWEPYTATYNQQLSLNTLESDPQDVFFKPDGTKLYIIGRSGDDINEYNVSTAWRINSASYSQRFSISSKETDPTGIFFKSDGTTVWVIGFNSDSVHEYSLSTAWDVSTMSFEQSFSVSSEDTAPSGVHFKDDGTKMYVIGSSSDSVHEYDLSTAWDISTASFSKLFNITDIETSPAGMWWKPDGSRLFITGIENDAVVAFNVGE